MPHLILEIQSNEEDPRRESQVKRYILVGVSFATHFVFLRGDR